MYSIVYHVDKMIHVRESPSHAYAVLHSKHAEDTRLDSHINTQTGAIINGREKEKESSAAKCVF